MKSSVGFVQLVLVGMVLQVQAADGFYVVQPTVDPKSVRVRIDGTREQHAKLMLQRAADKPPASVILASGEQLRGMYGNYSEFREFVRSSVNPVAWQFAGEERVRDAWKTYTVKVDEFERRQSISMVPWKNPLVEKMYEWGGRDITKKGFDVGSGALTGMATETAGPFGTIVVGGISNMASAKAMSAIDRELSSGTAARRQILGELVVGISDDLRKDSLVSRDVAEQVILDITQAASPQVKELLGLNGNGRISIGEIEQIVAQVNRDPGGFDGQRSAQAMAQLRAANSRLQKLGVQLGKLNILQDVAERNLEISRSTEYKVDALLSLLPPDRQIMAMSRSAALPDGVKREDASWQDYCAARSHGSHLDMPCKAARAQQWTRNLQDVSAVVNALQSTGLVDANTAKSMIQASTMAQQAIGAYMAFQTGGLIGGIPAVAGLFGGGGSSGPSPEQVLLEQVLRELDGIRQQLNTVIDLQIQLSQQVAQLHQEVLEATNTLYRQGTDIFEAVQDPFWGRYAECTSFSGHAMERYAMHAGLFPNYDARARHFNEEISASTSLQIPCWSALKEVSAPQTAEGRNQLRLHSAVRAHEKTDQDAATSFTKQVYEPMLLLTRAWGGLDVSLYGQQGTQQRGCEVNLATVLSTPPASFFALRKVPGKCGTEHLPSEMPKGVVTYPGEPLLGFYAMGDRVRYGLIESISAHARLLAPYPLLACRTDGGLYNAALVKTTKTSCDGTRYKLSGVPGADLLRNVQNMVVTSIAQDTMLSGVYLVPRFYELWKERKFETESTDLLAYGEAVRKARDLSDVPSEQQGTERKAREEAVTKARDKLGFAEKDGELCTHKDLYFRTLCVLERNALFRQNLITYAVLRALQESTVGYDRSAALLDSNGQPVPGIKELKPTRPGVAQYAAGLSMRRGWLLKSALPNLPLVPVTEAEATPGEHQWAFDFIGASGQKIATELPSENTLAAGAVSYAPQVMQAVEELKSLQATERLLRAETLSELGLPKDAAPLLVLAPETFRIEYFQNPWAAQVQPSNASK